MKNKQTYTVSKGEGYKGDNVKHKLYSDGSGGYEKQLTPEEASHHEKAYSLGIGPTVRYDGGVLKSGDNYTSLDKLAAESHKFSPEDAEKVHSGLNKIQDTLQESGWVHTDIKPANIVVDKETNEVRAIDWDHAKDYGELREVSSECNENTLPLGQDQEICSSKTDDKGFAVCRNTVDDSTDKENNCLIM
jgi:hypothetical protein